MSLTVWYIIILCVIAATIAYVCWNYLRIKKMPEGTPEMVEMAGIIRSGANTFMKTEYRTIAIVVALLALVFSLFVEKTSGITFLMGALMSSTVCVLGMRSATYANVRTANKARESMSIGETVKVALCGGSISGLSVQAFGLLGLILVLVIFGNVKHDVVGGGLLTTLEGINPTIMRISTYSLGCSLVAMFNRVAGGNYTKAADISADILAKVRNDLPEDDSRVPNVIADFIGDNVNDIAGNCSDLLESFVATISAALMIAVILFQQYSGKVEAGALDTAFNAMITYPVVLAGLGLVGCLMGLVYAAVKKMGNNPSRELNLATWISAGLTLVLGFFGAMIAFRGVDASVLKDSFGWVAGWVSPWICAVLGIASGVAIGSITEYYTSTDYKPTKTLAEMAPEGEAFVVTKGDAIGSRSVPAAGAGDRSGAVRFRQAGRHLRRRPGRPGHAGLRRRHRLHRRLRPHRRQRRRPGRKLPPGSRRPQDHRQAGRRGQHHRRHRQGLCHRLRRLRHRFPDRLLCRQLFLRRAGSEHRLLRRGGRRHHRRRPGGILLRHADGQHHRIRQAHGRRGRQAADPRSAGREEDPRLQPHDQLAAKEALRKMLVPSVLAMVIPVIGGFLFGVEFVGGLLIGATIVAIPRAIFMGNSGGAFDNAKKYIESGALKGHGKGSAAHKAAVTGDTVGDTRKDVVGVALDIFIKTMSTVANTLVSLFRNITLIR